MTVGDGLAMLGLFLGFGMGAAAWLLARGAESAGFRVAEAVSEWVEADRFRTKVAGGLVRRKEPKEPDTPEDLARFRAWLASQEMSEEERDDLDGRYQAVIGLRSVPTSVRSMYRETLASIGAPMPRS